MLEDILYDFEDYTEADTFEAARFASVQAATKALALNVIDIIKKTKFETPKSRSYSPPPSTKFPPLPPLPPMPSSRSPSVSSAPGTPIGHPRPRRPATPAGVIGERSNSPLPSLPPRSSERLVANGKAETSPASPSSEQAESAPHPLRAPNSRRNHDRLNTSSFRSQRSMASNRSRTSQASTGSVESQPPPAYTAAGEAIPPVPQPPQDVFDQVTPSRAESLERPTEHDQHEQPHTGTPNQDNLHRDTRPSPTTTTETNGASYSVFPPVARSNHGTRINAWVSDQADPAARAQQHRPSLRYEPHSLQALQNLQSLTIPEHQAIGVVRPKHASVIDFSPLTPMLSQLGQFSIESSAASSASVDNSSPERSRMSPLSQATTVSDFHNKPESPLPLQTPDESIETRLDPLHPSAALTPLSLPAAALEQQQQQQQQHQRSQFNLRETSQTPTQIHPAIPEEWSTVVSDRGSVAGFSSNSLSSSQPSGPVPREPDTSIGPRSSLYALGGFCTGGQNFKASAHQDGVRRLAGHVAGVSTSTARCQSCSYGHAFSELDLDVNDKSPRATFPRPGGVLFRIRFLYKSHLASQRPSEAFYGCLFCTQTGSVVHEGDATVFKSSDDLFRHLARHSQPLPEVAGVTVLHGKEILTTDPRVSDFDLWLTDDPSPPPPDMPGADVLARLPVATAGRSHVQRYAEKKLPRPDGKSGDSLLQFFVGARIIGVEFPRSLGGKWCAGWHDGEWGYFPAKAVELEKPKQGRLDAPPLQFQGTGTSGSAVSVVARWKWDPAASIRDAADKGWMGFDRGERITNVGWPVLVEGLGGGGREAWCWSGTNSKGRFGVFPRSHVDEGTLRDEFRPASAAGGGGAGRRKEKGGGKAAGKSLFGVRRRNSTTSSRDGGIAEFIDRTV